VKATAGYWAGQYIKAGGGMTGDLQEAQVFGWAKRARDNLAVYRGRSGYEVIPVEIVVMP